MATMRTIARLLVVAVLIAGFTLSVHVGAGPAEASPGDDPVRADFNGDGYDDLAVGAPQQDVGGKVDAGAVNVVFGSEQGPGTANFPRGKSPSLGQLITQDTAGVPDVSEAGDRFGYAVLAARLNNDRYVDLVIGVPNEDVGRIADAGSVHILYGSPGGLMSTGSAYFTQDSAGIAGTSEPGDQFGISFAAADFGRSADVDLAIGEPFEDAGGKSDGGVVHVLYGTPNGPVAAGSVVLSQDTAGVPGALEKGDRFGASLAAGNFGRSAAADLAIGVPFEDLNGPDVDAGLVEILYGSSTGLTGTGSLALNQDTPGVASSAEAGDRFGSALAAADFGRTAHVDLAVSAPTEDLVGEDIDVGVVHVFYGSSAGIVTAGSDYISQDTGNIPGATEPGDQFGTSLATGQFGKTEHQDLAVGVPREDLVNPADQRLTNVDAGGVYILLGSSIGVETSTATFFCQDSLEVPSTGERDDDFAWTLSAGNFGGTDFDDLAVGVPFEDLEGARVVDAGAVNLFFGSTSGTMKEKLPRYLTRNDITGVGRPLAGDRFGYSLGAQSGR